LHSEAGGSAGLIELFRREDIAYDKHGTRNIFIRGHGRTFNKSPPFIFSPWPVAQVAAVVN
jgi:hypothetical protein